MKRSHRCAMAALGPLLLMVPTACGGNEQENATNSPVITIADDWNSYPAAAMSGTLKERDGCLLIGQSVVFWPRGTTWNADSKTVVQSNGTRVAVGEKFSGGGGSYDPDTDFAGLVGSTAGEAVKACLEKTRAQEAVIATP